jgi:type I restriction enzyme, S subunit
VSNTEYAGYKDSGVEWLGAIPQGWEVVAIKRLSPVLRGASPRPIDDPKYFDEDGLYAWVRIADVSASNGTFRNANQKLSSLGSSLSVKLEPDSLFVSIAGSVGKPCITAIKACIHDGFVFFPRLRVDKEFLFRIFEAGLCYAGLGKLGTQLNLNTDTIGSIKIALPSENEIISILGFLDRETGKIDALVAEQERLIALLKEKRQAVISQAVTKGLDPNVPMKNSGVEWLGIVPSHWGVTSIKRVVSDVVDCLHTTPHYDGETKYPAIRTADVERGRLLIDQARLVSQEVYEERIQRLRPISGDVLYTREGERSGLAALVPEGVDLCLGQRMMMFRTTLGHDPAFLMWAMNSDFVYQQVLATLGGATAPHVNIADVVNLCIPVPPVTEQSQIANFIEQTVTGVDCLVAEVERAEVLLKERRTALISAAVTGKIDVRHLAHPAYKEPAVAA